MPDERNASYLSPKCHVVDAPEKGGKAIIATRPIAKGEIVCVWGGTVEDEESFNALPAAQRAHSVQVEEGLYLAVLSLDEPASYFNHSCNPNTGFSGQIALAAMRDIQPGEELTFDYALCDTSPYDEFECQCGSRNCRHKVTGNDWQNPALWERYAGYFSPYLQRRIDRLRGIRE